MTEGANTGEIVDRIHGALLGAAIGDAMGAATELRTREQILERFGGEVTTFVTPPDDTFARGCPPGQVTDDFSQAYRLATAIVVAGGRMDAAAGRAAILDWWEDERFQRFAGPTTAAAVRRLRGEEVEEPFFLYRGGQATNGAAMRIAPVGCVASSADEAIDAAIAVSLPTHDNHLAVAAAAVVAAGVASAIRDGAGTGDRPFSPVAEACRAAAVPATRRAQELTHTVPGASIPARLALALDLAAAAGDVREAAERIADVVGCGLKANEAVPAAVGILAAAPDAMSAIVAAVNAGDDTDTVATIVGALAGAAAGSTAFPSDLAAAVAERNDMDLRALAESLAAVRTTSAAPATAGRDGGR